MRTRRVLKQPDSQPEHVSRTWFDGRDVTLLRTDGVRNFYGVRDSQGEVVSRIELRHDRDINREEARREESVNVLKAIDAKEIDNAID